MLIFIVVLLLFSLDHVAHAAPVPISITNGSIVFGDAIVDSSLNLSAATTDITGSNNTGDAFALNVATRFNPLFLNCASGCPAGQQPISGVIVNQLSRGTVTFNQNTGPISFINQLLLNGVISIPSTTAELVTVSGPFSLSGHIDFEFLSPPPGVLGSVDLSGTGFATIPLRQAQPGLFVPAGPQSFDFPGSPASTVPEPSSWFLFSIALIGFAYFRKRQKARSSTGLNGTKSDLHVG